MDYNTLIAAKTTPGSIKAWVRYTEIDPPLVLSDAQSYIYQRMRVREMRAITSGSIILGAESLVMPTDFLDPVVLQIRYPQTVIKPINEKALLIERRTYDDVGLIEGMPMHYALIGASGYFDYKSDALYTYDLIYFKSPLPLGPSNQTNFLTDRYPVILRHACVGFAAMMEKDSDEAGLSLKLADALIDDAKAQDDLSRRGQEP